MEALQKAEVILAGWQPDEKAKWECAISADGTLKVLVAARSMATAIVEVTWPLGPGFLDELSRQVSARLAECDSIVKAIAQAVSVDKVELVPESAVLAGHDGCFVTRKGELHVCNQD